MKYASSLIIAATLLSSCVQPPPPPPPAPVPAYCPPVKKTTTSTTTKTTAPAPAPAPPAPAGRTVDGRLIRDTPPEALEPAKTLRVEKDF